MTATLGTSPRGSAAHTPTDLRVTPAALRLLQRLQSEGGDVALLRAPSAGDEVLCLGQRDFVPGPNDLLIATIRACPMYLDRRDVRRLRGSAGVLDVQRDLAGWHFVCHAGSP